MKYQPSLLYLLALALSLPALGQSPPAAYGFDYPVGAPSGAGYHTVPDYPGHVGEDWNGNLGGNTDYGDDVFAIADGKVIEAKTTENAQSDSWGRILLVEHILPDGSKLWSQYAHLKSPIVGVGNLVTKGQKIAEIGNAGGYYSATGGGGSAAHLHFEIRTQPLPAAFWPVAAGWTQSQIDAAYYDDPATEFIDLNRMIPPNAFNSFPDLGDSEVNGNLNGRADVGLDWRYGFRPLDPENTVYRIQISKVSTSTDHDGFTTSRSAGGNVVVNHVIDGSNPWGSGSSFVWDASQVGTLTHVSAGQVQTSVSEAPQPEATYFWRVYAYNTVSMQRSEYSALQQFTTNGSSIIALTIDSPAAGSVWTTGATESVRWTTTGAVGSEVRIEIQADGSGTWNPFLNSTANDGIVSFVLPSNYPAGFFRLKLSNLDNSIVDVSESFEIVSDDDPSLQPDIAVLGGPDRDVAILDGSTSPRTANGTLFGTLEVEGESEPHELLIDNTGPATLNVSSVTSSSGEFLIDWFESEILAGNDTATLRITFDPDRVGIRSGTITIRSDDPDEDPFTFVVRGWGADPGCIVLDHIEIDDSDNGNGDGDVNPGEIIELEIFLRNLLSMTAHDVSVLITTNDPYVISIGNNPSNWPGNGLRSGEIDDGLGDYDIAIRPDCPDGHVIEFEIAIASDQGAWPGNFSLTVTGPPPAAERAWLPIPPDNRTTATDTIVSWQPGRFTEEFRVFFGTNPAPEANGPGIIQSETEYLHGGLVGGQTYFWRVDSRNLAGVWTIGEVWSFSTAPETLVASPERRDVAPEGGSVVLTITSNTTWIWSGGATWIAISEAQTQSGNAEFEYTVAANPNPEGRSATLIFQSGQKTAMHTICQGGLDDHGDDVTAASPVQHNVPVSGALGDASDADYFRIELVEPSRLLAYTTGATDTDGSLIGSLGLLMGDDNSGEGSNMKLWHELLAPGVYYLRVAGSTGTKTGPYSLTVKTLPESASMLTSLQHDAATGSVEIGLTKQSGWHYRLQRSQDGLSWTTFTTYFPGASGEVRLDDSGVVDSFARMFYRLAISEE